MAPLHSEPDTDWDSMPHTPMEKLAELEARMALKEGRQDATIDALKQELKDLKEKIGELITLLETFKNAVKFFGAIERGAIFLAKVGGSVAIMYGMYKFGLAELAEKVKSAGGK